jgi:uncharacterized membrane-anchored protein YhcB (DUF1043 family)
MQFTLDLIINPIILLLAGVSGIIIGYVFALAKIAKARAKIQKMELDLLSSNEETLEAQRAYVDLEARLQDQSIPVIPMKINGKETSKEKATK